MSFHCIKQFILNVQTFRNIQLWYQGVYFLKFQIYIEQHHKQNKTQNNPKQTISNKIHAYPYAITQSNLFKNNTQIQENVYDGQIISNSFIDSKSYSFYTKAFNLKYFQEQVQINDICHFRIEVDPFNNAKYRQKNDKQRNSEYGQYNQYTLQVGLWFYDSYKKDGIQLKQYKNNSKQVRNIKYIIKSSNHQQNIQINQYIPILFQDQYFSLINTTIHTINIDYKFRLNTIQLAQFAQLTVQQKKLLFQKIKSQMKNNNNKNNLSTILINKLNTNDEKKIIKQFNKLLQLQVQTGQKLFIQYKKLFEFSVTQNQVNYLSQYLIYPNQLSLYITLDNDPLLRQQTAQLNLISSLKNSIKSQNLQERLIKILNKINIISSKNLKIWSAFIKLIKVNTRFFVAFYQKIHKKQQQKFWQQLIKHDNIQNGDINYSHKQNFNNLIKQLQISKQNIRFSTSIYNNKLFSKRLTLPLMIVQSYKNTDIKCQQIIKIKSVIGEKIQNHENNNKNNQQDKIKQFPGIHLVILAHGFQGSSYDMKLIKNNIAYLFPQTMYLCCTANQDKTDDDIFQMGNRLALQIKNFIFENFPNNTLGKISFIGHSLGGLKIRAALPKLLEYKDKFHCYISFSSPHLGYKVNTSSVVEAGLWILQKMKQSQCLKQLSMTDSQNLYETAMYKLSLEQGLQYFNKIFLFSSIQDSYAPYQSARIQIDQSFLESNNPIKNIHCEMVKNILKNVNRQTLNRFLIHFTINTKNFDSFIGRTAHIMFLEVAQIIRTLLSVEENLFR